MESRLRAKKYRLRRNRFCDYCTCEDCDRPRPPAHRRHIGRLMCRDGSFICIKCYAAPCSVYNGKPANCKQHALEGTCPHRVRLHPSETDARRTERMRESRKNTPRYNRIRTIRERCTDLTRRREKKK